MKSTGYEILIGKNGMKYVSLNSVGNDNFNVSKGNSKIGKTLNFSFPIEKTCRKDCECYKLKICYGCSGCYLFGSNQARYSENFNYYVNHSTKEFVNMISKAIIKLNSDTVRFNNVGDIPDMRFITCLDILADTFPDVSFYGYTKKYEIVNRWIAENGFYHSNLTIIFSHWLNRDGSYFPMDNKYNLPISEFIPIGMEYLTEKVTHICPCSNPDFIGTCKDCDYPCKDLKPGESMALLEHSTKETKERDKQIKEVRKQKKGRK